MSFVKVLCVRLLAAIAAGRAPRKPGIDAFIPSMLLLAPILAMPLFALQLLILRLATLAHPLLREPWLTLGIDSTGLGLIAAAELIQRWQVPIDAELAKYDLLDPRRRFRRRLQAMATGAGIAVLFAVLPWWLTRR